MHLATTFDNRISHVLDDTGKFVRTDVWMSIYKNRCTCSVLTENIQNLVHITTLLASGIEFTVRVSAGTTFAKTIIAFRIYLMFTTDLGDVHLSITYIFASFYHDRAKSMFD